MATRTQPALTVAGAARRALAALLFAALVACTGCATLRVSTPATALLHEDPADNPDGRVLLSLTGRGFGRRDGTSGVRLRSGDGRLIHDFRSDDRARVLLWTDRRIVLAAPAAIAEEPALTVEVATAVAASAPAQVAFFSYRHFDVPRSDTRTNASPLAIAVDDRSRVAVNEEFHTQLKRLDAAIGWEVFDLPRGPTENIFAAHFVADNPTRLSMLGESIVVDPSGRTWATEGGWMLYAGVHPNHSRIVMLEPDGGTPQIWPVPGDDNSVVGITYEPATGRVWFTQAQRARREDGVTHIAYQARLTSFDPRAIPPDADFDFVPSERCELASGAHVGVCGTTRWRRCFDDDDCVLADRVCRDDAPDDGACFREYEIPTAPGDTPLALPGPLLRHSDGTIWFSGYWGGNYVGRFDPATETFQRFPLARPPGETSCDRRDCVCFPPEGSRERACSLRCCLYVVLGRGPWTLVEDDGGGVAFCAQEAGAVARLPRQRFRDPRCAALSATGTNICMLEYPLLDYDPATTQLHSLALDGAGNLWFGESRIDGRDEDAARGASLGYVQAGTGDVILLPPLSLYPFTSSGAECRPAGEAVAYSAVGIAFDPRTGSVWSADYCRKRLGEITPRRASDEP